jgi:hypothetical protein
VTPRKPRADPILAGHSHAAARFDLAMAIVRSEHVLSPEILAEVELAGAEEADWRISSPTRRKGAPRCGVQEVQLRKVRSKAAAVAMRIIGGHVMPRPR